MPRSWSSWTVLPLLAAVTSGVLASAPASAEAPGDYRGALIEQDGSARYVAFDSGGTAVLQSPAGAVDGALGRVTSTGPTLLYVSETGSGSSVVDRLHLIDPVAGDRVLYSAPAGVELSEPSLSPAGDAALLVSDSSTTSAILSVDLASATVRTIRTSGTTAYYGPSFSPDGVWLSWSQQNSAGSDLVVTRFASGAATVLSHSSGWSFEDSTWSPDGSQIAVTTTMEDPETGYPLSSLVLFDARTGTWRALRLGRMFPDSAVSYLEPAWTPDGTAVLSTVLTDHFDTGDLEVTLQRTSLSPDEGGTPLALDGFLGASSTTGLRPDDTEAPSFGMTATTGAAAQLAFSAASPDIAEFVVTRSTGGATGEPMDAVEVGRTRQSGFTVPLPQPRTTYDISVRARDWAGNLSAPVTTTVTSTGPSAITVSTPPARVHWRTGVTLTGVLSGPDGPLAGQTVEMYARRAMTSTFVRVATAKTDTQGAYRVGFVPQWTAELQVRSVGSALAYPAASAKRIVTVIPAATLRASSYRSRVGGAVTLAGEVGPNHAGQTVTLQRKVSGVWRNVTTLRLSSTSSFRYSLALPTRGTWELRTYKPADGDHALTTSNGVTISVG